MNRCRLCIVLWSISLGLIGIRTADAIDIAKDGASEGSSTTQAAIVVSAQATLPERHAAAELADFLKQVTGAALAVTEKAEAGRPHLLVGPDAARLRDPAFEVRDLGQEGFVIRTVGNDLILAGGRPRGTLYAVYAFLEDHVGCRWWSPTVSTIPHRPSLAFDALDVKVVPKLEYREPFWFSAFDGDWAVRNKCNGASMRLDEQRGGRHVIQGFVHTFYPLIPPEKYFKDHPDWFSEINAIDGIGRRKYEQTQLCLSNADLRKELVKNLKELLRKNPAATMASVSQNDWHGQCQCPRCAAVDKEEESPAGSMLRFVNAVAGEVRQEFPNVSISTLAYQYTRKPPKMVRPGDGVVVWLCSIECSFDKPLTDERNAAFRTDIEGWSKICDRLYVWDYTTNFRHYILPHPNLRVLGPNVQFFVDHHVKGIFEQGAYHTWGAEMMELRAWVLAKLLWNPSLDAGKLIDEFLHGYYGPAAEHVRAYLNLIHDAANASGDYLGCFSAADAKFLSIQTLSKGLAELKAAEQAAGADAAIRQRVQVAQLPVLYAFLIEWDRLQEQAKLAGLPSPVAQHAQDVYEQFMTIAKAIGVTHVAEGRQIDWLKSQVKTPRIIDRVSCSSLCQARQPLETALKNIAELGYQYVDLAALSWCSHVSPAALVEDFEKEASRVESALTTNHLRVSNLTYDSIEQRPFEDYEKQFTALVQFAARTKTRLVNIMAPSVKADRQDAVAKLRKLQTIAERSGVILTLETHTNQITEKPADAAWLCRQVPGLGLTLDPSHYYAGPNQGADFDNLYPLVQGTGLRAGGMSWAAIQLPWGEGPIDFAEIVRKLEKAGYKGFYVSEYIEKLNQVDALKESRRFLEWARKF